MTQLREDFKQVLIIEIKLYRLQSTFTGKDRIIMSAREQIVYHRAIKSTVIV